MECKQHKESFQLEQQVQRESPNREILMLVIVLLTNVNYRRRRNNDAKVEPNVKQKRKTLET